MNDEAYGRPFSYYLLFTHWPFLLPTVLDKPQVFYNRYYWFQHFGKVYQGKRGPDAGVEQQGFQLLESADFDLDWQIIEKLDARAKRASQSPNREESP